MTLAGLIRRVSGRASGIPRQAATVIRRLTRAGYDAAKTTDENRRHWANADTLSADAAASPEVRLKLRTRARYEVANNTYARGIVHTLANDVIGTGPRLQLRTGDDETDRTIERAFAEWARDEGLADKLRTMRIARAQDGEAFAIIGVNPERAGAVKTSLSLIEADQVCTPDLSYLADDNAVDGIRFDQYGNPVEYHVLKRHPGAPFGLGSLTTEYDPRSPDVVVHWFRPDRPQQRRGIPEISAALPLFAQLRRYTLAVIGAAEVAANHAVVLKTEAPGPDDDEIDELAPFSTEEINRVMYTALPAGTTAEQMDAKQPTTTYQAFKQEILKEIARCLHVPYNVAAGDSSGYNYSSAQLDHLVYGRSLNIDRKDCERVVLRRVLSAFLKDAALVEALVPPAMRGAFSRGELPEHAWFWDGRVHGNPIDIAKAQAQSLLNGTTTLADECAKDGLDWQDVTRQRAKEAEFCRSLKLPVPWEQQPAAPTAGDAANQNATDQEPANAS